MARNRLLQRRLLASLASGSAGATSAPAAISATGLVTRWTAGFSTLTTSTDAQGRPIATQINDMIAAAHAISSGTEHPLVKTDLQGRRYLQFNALSWAAFTTAYLISFRSLCTYFVGRPHRPPAGGAGVINILTVNDYSTYAHMNIAKSTDTPFLRMVNGNTASAVGSEKVVAGNQMQVLVTRSTTAIKCWVNENSVVPAGAGTAGTQTTAGGQIGAFGGIPTGGFDLYEIALYTSGYADADVQGSVPGDPVLGGNIGVLMDYYNIAPIERSIELGPDSITFGFPLDNAGNNGTVPSGDCLGVTLARLMADNNVRLVTTAVTGSTAGDMTVRRDSAFSMFSAAGGFVAGWQNDVHIMVGTNDQHQVIGTGLAPVWTTAGNSVARGDEAMDRVNGIIALANTPLGAAGYLQRGANKVYYSTVIARSSGGMLAIDQMRLRMMDPAFLVSCDADAGGTYPGKVVVIPLHQWTVSGATIFDTATNALDLTYYQTDFLHPRAAGTYQFAKCILPDLGLTAA
mgnify:FL=1